MERNKQILNCFLLNFYNKLPQPLLMSGCIYSVVNNANIFVKHFKKIYRLEAFPVDDRGTRLVVLLLGDPHLLEGGE